MLTSSYVAGPKPEGSIAESEGKLKYQSKWNGGCRQGVGLQGIMRFVLPSLPETLLCWGKSLFFMQIDNQIRKQTTFFLYIWLIGLIDIPRSPFSLMAVELNCFQWKLLFEFNHIAKIGLSSHVILKRAPYIVICWELADSWNDVQPCSVLPGMPARG